MTTKQEWIALAERCEKATGPDREIDASIIEATGWDVDRTSNLHWMSEDELPSLTTSLDAITALIERELQGCAVKSGSTLDGQSWAVVYLPPLPPSIRECGGAKTEALARCAAFCRAMAERAEA